MSGPIRRVLGPARARAKTLIDKPIDKYDTAANAAKTPQERIQEVNRVKLSINHDMDKLQNAINYLHEKDTQWQNLFPSLGTDEKPAEEKEYARHSDMSDGHLALIFNGQDKLSDMKSHVQELDNLKSQFEQEITQQAIAAAQVPMQAPVQPAPAAPVTQLKLPKIELPFFDGDPANSLPFWDIFEGAVHNQNISGGQKLAYLNSKLTKSALNAVTGLPVTNDNYQVAVDILKKRFGQPAVIRNALITKLGDLKISSSSPRELRSTQDCIERTLRQLEALNEDIEQPILADILKRKLPADILTEMQRLKATADAPWTVAFIRQSLGTVIQAREEIQQVVQAQSSASKGGQQGFKPASGQSFQSRSNSPVTTTTGSLSTGIQLFARGRGNPRARVNARGAQSGKGRPTASSQGSPGAQSSAQSRISCVFCGKNHYSSSCSNFPTVDSRRTQIMKLRDPVCMKCLRTGHMARNCTRYVKCYHCKSDRHNTAFCPKQYSGNQSVSSSVTEGATEQRGSASGQSQVDSGHAQPTHLAPVSVTVDADRKIIANQAESRTKSSMLMTARAMVSNPNSPSYTAPVQIFFDNGAQRTFIKASLKDRLGLHTNSQQEELLIYTFGSPRPHYKKCDHVSFDLLLKDGSHFPIEADSIPHLTAAQTRPTLCKEDKGFIQKYFSAELFADTVPFDSTPFDPDIIVGEDYFWDFMEDFPKIKLPSGMYAIPSRLGLMLGGKYILDSAQEANALSLQIQCIMNMGIDALNPSLQSHAISVPDPIIPPSLEDFWKLESIGITDSLHENEDDSAVEQFNSSIEIQDGRYYVKWPYNDNIKILPDNKLLSLKRLRSLTKRFQAEPELLPRYADIIETQTKLGIIEPVEKDADDGRPFHYLPHHPIITPQKTTTKVRIVYDGSARSRNSVSVNNCLLRGQVILPDLCGLLVRFRLHPTAIVADVEKAFLQVGLHEKDRDITRFLWFKDSTKADDSDSNIQIYRFCRIPFGIISSPFLLAATIKYHLNQYDSEVAKLILDNIYVDNVIIGVSSFEAALKVYQESKQMFQEASMNLREWTSNNHTFTSHLPEKDKVTQSVTKILGLLWNSQTDELIMTAPKIKDSIVTKRTVVQSVSSIFDPLGFATPVTLKGKLFIQSLWSKSLDWDIPLSTDLQHQWEHILSDLSSLTKIHVPRFIQFNEETPFELHAFIDASAKVYAVVVYIRQSNGKGNFTVNLIFSKVRLAPTKPSASIPRLELLALLIGARALLFLQRQIHVPVSSCFLWSDSQCCLHWLVTKRPLARFVGNRIKEIDSLRKELTNVSFHYVQTKDNPADMATRGILALKLQSSQLWWQGPQWLSSDTWPQHHFPPVTDEVLEKVEKELRQPRNIPIFSTSAKVKAVQSPKLTANFLNIHAENYSSLLKLYRITVQSLRFLNKLRPSVFTSVTFIDSAKLQKCGPVTPEEIAIAQCYWDHVIQMKHFSEVHKSILNQSSHPLTHSLGLQVDSMGLIRCHGRFQNANVFQGNFPVLLPKDSHYTNLVIQYYHSKVLHSGVQHTLLQLRQRYWIPTGRAIVRKLLQKCTVCRKVTGGAYRLPPMAPLPKERLTRANPFQFTGLDYLGPLWYKFADSKKKAYVCLFTCLVTRAIHLELVSDLSTTAFLNALRRFFARRGTPEKILSDNASQLLLGKSAIQKAWFQVITDDEVMSYCASNSVIWRTTTPFAPWQGGVYERLVGLTKNSLKKAIGRKLLTWEQLNTLLPEIEAVLNSRPLTYLYSDVNSFQVLRPVDFMIPHGKVGTPDFQEDRNDPEWTPKMDSKDKVIKFWKSSQIELDKFWNLWYSEYLSFLRERTQTDHVQPRIQSPYQPSEGDVALIQEENLPRGLWKMGKILKLNVSSDRQIRSADVLLPNKNVLERSLKQLHPLEIVHSLAYSSVPEGNTNQSASSSNATTVGTSSRVKDSIGRALTSNLMKYNLSVMLFCCLFFSMLCFSTVNGLPFNRTYQLCSRVRSVHALAVPTEFHCKLPGSKPPTKTAVELWTLRQKPQTTVAYHCYIQTHTIITHTSFVLGKGIMADLTEYSSVLPSYCWTAVNSKTWDNIPLVEISPGFWSSNLTLHVSYTWCCYDVKNTVANFFIEVGQIASIDGKKLVSDLQDLSACTPVSRHCQNQDMGVTVWNDTVFQNECAYVHFGSFSATISGSSIIVARIQGAFSYSGKAHPPDSECVPDDAFYADQGATFIRFINETPSSWQEIATRRLKVPEELLEFEDLSNYKRFFMYKKILQIESREFSLIWHQLCSIRQTQLNHVWELMRLDPSLGVRAFLGRTDLYAEWAGEALVFWECRNITPTTIHWSAKINGTCYKYTPVQLKPHGPLWFVSPGSRDLVTSSPTEECNHASVHYFLGDNGNWYSAHGPVHVTTVPLEMTWKGLWSTFTFDAPSLFSRSIGHFSNFIDVQHQIQRLKQVEHKIQHLINYTAEIKYLFACGWASNPRHNVI